MWLPRYTFLSRPAAAALHPAVRMRLRWSHRASRWNSLGDGEVPRLINLATLETQTTGPASPQLQLEGVGAQHHLRTKSISYWYCLLSVSSMPGVVISELCLSPGTQMHCELLLPLFQA